MATEKDKWIARILGSAEDIRGLHAPAHLFPRILDTIENQERDVVKLSFGQVRIALAAACILALLNVGILLMADRSAPSPGSAYIESYDLNLYK